MNGFSMILKVNVETKIIKITLTIDCNKELETEFGTDHPIS